MASKNRYRGIWITHRSDHVGIHSLLDRYPPIGTIGTEPFESIDAAGGDPLVGSGTRATQIVPSTGIDDKDRSVGVEQEVDGMKVDAIGTDQRIGYRLVVCLVVLFKKWMEADLVQIELRAEQVALGDTFGCIGIGRFGQSDFRGERA